MSSAAATAGFPPKLRQLREACDHALNRVRSASTETGHTTTHIAGFLVPEYFADCPDALAYLVDFVSSQRVLELLSHLGQSHGGTLSLRDIQYFHEPTGRSYEGAWHRDVDSPDPSVSDASAQQSTLVRCRLALTEDDCLEYIAGSHLRSDTLEEARVRKGAVRNADTLEPHAQRIVLEPGDICVLDTRGIHRARYRHERIRRTLDLVFGFDVPRTRITSQAIQEFLSVSPHLGRLDLGGSSRKGSGQT